jgi:hypothetical protein
MLVIRAKQIAPFRKQADEDFVQRVAGHLLEEYNDISVRLPDENPTVGEISGDTLRRMILTGIERASAYKMDWESTLTGFVTLMFVFAPNFDDHPQFKSILEDSAVEPNLRLDELIMQSSEDDWENVEQKYDVSSWNLD